MFLLPFLDLLETEEDKRKFEELYYEYTNYVMKISEKYLKSYSLAEDNCQDVFLYLAKNFEKVGEIKTYSTRRFLSLITKGMAINKYNKEVKRSHISFDDIAFLDIPDESIFSQLELGELKDAIKKLPEEDQIYLQLTYYYGYKSKEISKMYGISADKVRKRIQLSKAKLRKELVIL